MDCLKPSYSQNYGNVVGLTCYPKWADFSNTTMALCRDKIYLRNLNFSITLLNIAFYYNWWLLKEPFFVCSAGFFFFYVFLFGFSSFLE